MKDTNILSSWNQQHYNGCGGGGGQPKTLTSSATSATSPTADTTEQQQQQQQPPHNPASTQGSLLALTPQEVQRQGTQRRHGSQRQSRSIYTRRASSLPPPVVHRRGGVSSSTSIEFLPEDGLAAKALQSDTGAEGAAMASDDTSGHTEIYTMPPAAAATVSALHVFVVSPSVTRTASTTVAASQPDMVPSMDPALLTVLRASEEEEEELQSVTTTATPAAAETPTAASGACTQKNGSCLLPQDTLSLSVSAGATVSAVVVAAAMPSETEASAAGISAVPSLTTVQLAPTPATAISAEAAPSAVTTTAVKQGQPADLQCTTQQQTVFTIATATNATTEAGAAAVSTATSYPDDSYTYRVGGGEVALNPSKVPDDLICGICLSLAERPCVTECGHLFCSTCIHTALRIRCECPVDRNKLRERSLRLDVRAQRQINGLACRCLGGTSQSLKKSEDTIASASVAPCDWCGCVSDAPAHLAQCPYTHTSCSFADYGCHVVLPRRDMAWHLASSLNEHLLLTCRKIASVNEEVIALREETDVLRQRYVVPGVIASTSAASAAAAAGAVVPSSAVSPSVTNVVAASVGGSSAMMQSRHTQQQQQHATLPLLFRVRQTTPTNRATSPGPANAIIIGAGGGATAAYQYGCTFVWVVTDFMSRTSACYSRLFTAQGLEWYAGMDCSQPAEMMADAGAGGAAAMEPCGVYLFAFGHTLRVRFRLIIYNSDPAKDLSHIVDDWQDDYRGKGWGPLRFIDRSTVAQAGFISNDCVRIGIEVLSAPF